MIKIKPIEWDSVSKYSDSSIEGVAGSGPLKLNFTITPRRNGQGASLEVLTNIDVTAESSSEYIGSGYANVEAAKKAAEVFIYECVMGLIEPQT